MTMQRDCRGVKISKQCKVPTERLLLVHSLACNYSTVFIVLRSSADALFIVLKAVTHVVWKEVGWGNKSAGWCCNVIF